MSMAWMGHSVRARAAAVLVSALVVACNGDGGGDGGDTDTDPSTGSDTTIGTTASTTATTGPSTVTVTSSASVADTGTIDGPCCSARGEPGCSEDPLVAECVCETDRYCCQTIWDDVCAERVVELGCGVCEPGGSTVSTTVSTTDPSDPTIDPSTSDVTTGEPPQNIGGCCEPHPETGCEIAGLSECVCNFEPQCCSDEWDALCVSAVDDYGCGVCPPPPTTTTTMTTSESDTDTPPMPDNTEGCCITHDSTGCEYPSIAECVCGPNPECCTDAWTEACIDAVGDLGCGVCPP